MQEPDPVAQQKAKQQINNSIQARLENLRQNSNFFTKQIHIRDQLVVNVFVNHDKLDLQGRPISDVPVAEEPVSESQNQEEEKVEEQLQSHAEEAEIESSDQTDTESEEEEKYDLHDIEQEESQQDAQSEFTQTTIEEAKTEYNITVTESMRKPRAEEEAKRKAAAAA